jgi:prepilin-type N-terminal cleavage/methylation domain-containing protein
MLRLAIPQTSLDWVKKRLASESGFTLIELLVVVQVLSILTLIGVPTYVKTAARAKIATAQSNVHSAIAATATYYTDNVVNPSLYSYGSISGAKLRTVSPGISTTLKAGSKTVTITNDAYCIQDSGDGGLTFYRYEGGQGGASAVASGACPVAYSVT